MKRIYFSLLLSTVALLLLGAPSQAHASGSSIAKALGNLRWGMSAAEARNALKGKTDVRALESSQVDFDGKRSKWDGTFIGEEYTHGNSESMMTYKDKDAENYLFFFDDQLWKWVKVYPASQFRGKFTETVKKKFGKGYDKQGEVNPGSGASYSYTEFLDRNTRLRAVDKASEGQRYVLMFEAMDTVRSLSAMRSSTIRRGSPVKKTAVAKKPVQEDDEEESVSASRAPSPVSSPGTLASKSKNKKSIFADDQGDESEEEYNARKNRVQAQAREQQKRLHDRSEESKKGKILDELAGVDDDDPLGGMK